MIVKIQLLRDDGAIIVEHMQNALQAGGWESPIGVGPVLENAGSLATGDEGEPQIVQQVRRGLYGFTYLPVPPPRDPADVQEFRRLLAQYFGR